MFEFFALLEKSARQGKLSKNQECSLMSSQGSLNQVSQKWGTSSVPSSPEIVQIDSSHAQKQPKEKGFGWDIPRMSGQLSGRTSVPKAFFPLLGAQEN